MRSVLVAKAVAVAFLASLALAAPFAALAAEKVLAGGQFAGASDHATSGGVSVVQTDAGVVVVLEENFSLDGAPDPKVGFGKDGVYDIKSQLSPLAANTGRQSYPVPATIDTSKYNEVYIWCEQYSVPLGVAKLQ